jgi:hypothetical protein
VKPQVIALLARQASDRLSFYQFDRTRFKLVSAID